MEKIAIVLPAYNEELTIKATIEEFHKELPNASIYVINNRSSDNTANIAQKTLQDLSCEGKVLTEFRPGKGNAVRRGFLEIDADIYVMADADLTYPAQEVHKLIAPIKEGLADMVVGDRHSGGHYAKENKRGLHGFGNNLVKNLVNFLFKANLSDIMSGYRVFNRQFVKNYPILVEGFEIETDMTLHSLDKRFRIMEIPVAYKDRPEGSFSKLNTLSDGARVLKTIATILRYYRPLMFFTILALVFFILGVVCAIPVLQDWFRERYIYHVPLAILATGLEIVALFLFGIGLILDTTVIQDKRGFERDLLHKQGW